MHLNPEFSSTTFKQQPLPPRRYPKQLGGAFILVASYGGQFFNDLKGEAAEPCNKLIGHYQGHKYGGTFKNRS